MSREQLASLLLATALYTGAGSVLTQGLGLKAEELLPAGCAHLAAPAGAATLLQVRTQPALRPPSTRSAVRFRAYCSGSA